MRRIDPIMGKPVHRGRDTDAGRMRLLRRHLGIAMIEAENGDYSERTVAQIAESVLEEDNGPAFD